MDAMGLNKADLALAMEGLLLSHDVDVEVNILDMAGNLVPGPVYFTGDAQVEVDGDSLTTQSLSTMLYDPAGLITPIGLNRQVQCVYRYHVAALGGFVERVVFSGPVVRPPSRDEDDVSVECQDRSAIAMRGVPPKTYPAGNAVGTIRQILSEKCGETRFAFPQSHPDRLDDPVTVGWEDEVVPWVQCQQIADSLDMQLFYDGPVCRLREYPSAPVADLSDFVTSRQPREAPSEVVNRFKVIGKRPKDHTVVLTLPASHQASPESLAVNGVNQFFTVESTNDKLNTLAKVRKAADRLRSRREGSLVEHRGYDIVPVPNLHPLDVVTISGDHVRARRWSLPLTASGDMSLGYNAPLGRR